MKRIFALCCVIALTATFRSAIAEAPSIGISTEPATVLVNYRDNHASAHIIVATTKTTGLPALYVRAGMAKFGEINAPISFPGNDNRDFISLPGTTAQKQDVPIDITGIDAAGTYTATLEVALQGEGSTFLSTKLEVIRASSTFSPTLGGPGLKNNQLELTVNSGASRTTFFVQNPATSREREFHISLIPPMDKYLTVAPDRIRLPPGDQREIILTAQHAPPLGSSIGMLTISDVGDPNLAKETIVNVTRTINFWVATVIIFVLVLLGSVLSVVLNNVFPVSLTRFRNRSTLTDIETRIGACTRASGLLQSALLAEAARLRLLNGAFSWYTTDKGEQIKALGNFLSTLRSRLELTERISNERMAVAQSTRISVGLGVEIEERFSTAEEALLDNRPENAKTLIEEGVNLRATTTSPNVIVALRTDLTNEVNALIAAAAGGPSTRPQVITGMIADLQADLPKIATMPIDELLFADRRFNAVRVYIEEFEAAEKRNSNVSKFANDFALLVKTDVTSPDTVLLTSLIQNDLLPEDIAKEINDKSGRIECPLQVHPYQIEAFQFEFSKPVVNNVIAAKHLCRFNWDFNDHSKSPGYDRCNHFFVLQKPDKSKIRNQGFTERTVSVTVTAPFDRQTSATFTQSIKLLPRAQHGKAAIGMQVTTFAVSFIVAVFAAFGAQYGTIPALDSLSAWMAPFLFGFSLDQIRDKTLVTPP